nr:immunoglobulin heavy chain junction region [Mus musculus]
CVRNDGFAFW